MSGLKRIMVFVSSKDAKLFYKENGEIKTEIIESPITLKDEKVSGEGKDTFKFSPTHASNNEHKKHNQHQKEEQQYFKELESKILNYDVIYLTGPGTLKNKLNNYISENKKFADKSIFVEPEDNHLTENQLLAKARSVLF
ncbi:MAG: hypothetical protein Fur0023_18880 [Bacteroidia bacterium]